MKIIKKLKMKNLKIKNKNNVKFKKKKIKIWNLEFVQATMTGLTWNFDILEEGIVCEPHHVYRNILGYAKGQGGP